MKLAINHRLPQLAERLQLIRKSMDLDEDETERPANMGVPVTAVRSNSVRQSSVEVAPPAKMVPAETRSTILPVRNEVQVPTTLAEESMASEDVKAAPASQSVKPSQELFISQSVGKSDSESDHEQGTSATLGEPAKKSIFFHMDKLARAPVC